MTNRGRVIREYNAEELGTCYSYNNLVVVAEDAWNLYVQSANQPDMGEIIKISKETGNPVFADGNPLYGNEK